MVSITMTFMGKKNYWFKNSGWTDGHTYRHYLVQSLRRKTMTCRMKQQ